jgi:hypothetical protein
MERERLDQLQLMMSKLAEMLMRLFELFKLSNTLINTESSALLAGNLDPKPSSLIRTNQRNTLRNYDLCLYSKAYSF